MLPRDRAERILTLGEAGWSVRDIAGKLGHAPQTIRDYLNGSKRPGIRATRASLLTKPLASYCRQRLTEDPHLRPSELFREISELGFQASRSTFYREVARHLLPQPGHPHTHTQQQTAQELSDIPHSLAHPSEHGPVLPRPVTPITGEELVSYLTRLASANHLTVTEVLAVLPFWFTTKINNRDDRAQHHMLIPATAEALRALAHLTGTSPTCLARTLPAFGDTETHGPVRATIACQRCTARHGIGQLVRIHLPVHHKVCKRHGIWLDDIQSNLDLAACPEIITAQYRANRLLRRYTPQQLLLAYQSAAKAIPAWPASPAAIPLHWRHRLLALQTTNHHRIGIPPDHDTYTQAAIYPDAMTLAAKILLNPEKEQIIWA